MSEGSGTLEFIMETALIIIPSSVWRPLAAFVATTLFDVWNHIFRTLSPQYCVSDSFLQYAMSLGAELL
jgi:hypothetical protein